MAASRNWSFKADAAKQDLTESNFQHRHAVVRLDGAAPYRVEVTHVPEGGKSDSCDVNGDGVIGTWTWSTAPWDGNNAATKSFERYFNEDVASSVAFVKAVDGRGRSLGRNLRWNFIAGHNVTEGKLRGLSGNLAARFRSAPNPGYGLRTLPDGTVTFDLARAFGGKTEFYADLGLAYRGKTKFLGNASYRVQLNVRNLLDEHDLVPYRVLSTGQYVTWA